MRERKRRHDDAHFPLQGRGRRANRIPKTLALPKCQLCGKFPEAWAHLCIDKKERKP